MSLPQEQILNIFEKIIAILKKEVGEKDLMLSDIVKITNLISINAYRSAFLNIKEDNKLSKKELCKKLDEMIGQQCIELAAHAHFLLCRTPEENEEHEEHEETIDIANFYGETFH